ncbi:hypothetical protein BKI49_17140 [Streptomyces sp. Tue6028]|uniref:hypothetical protein n=1 Tax=Streptomyces sp. Tue6028 TaxID=2036037 RepID=UPI000BB340C0|nr:hypothetical protein [Streptomyces sp. Tue6028]PBC63057.1 hypothetical protein BKI49_17140 [Streptomyces sp. Tue6028]
MSNQPHEGRYEHPHEGYDPYRQQQSQPSSHHPQQQNAPEPDWQQHTQQWEGQTWETQMQPPVPAADTAHLPPHGYQQAYQGQGHVQGGQGHDQGQGYQEPHGYGHGYGPGVTAQPLPQENAHGAAQGWDHTQAQYQQQGHQAQQQPVQHQQPQAQHHQQAQQPQAQYQQQPVQQAQQPVHPQHQQAQAQSTHVQAQPQQPGAPAEDGASGYGPPTLTGNTRVTDAQRARAEGRSPIIEPGIQPAGLTAALGLLMSGAAAVGEYALLVPLVLLQAVTAAGWFRLNGMWPARQGIALAFLGAVTADVALLGAGRENAPAAILGTLGVWVLLTLVLQLRSHADPDTRMSGLMATVASAALSIVAAGHLAAEPDAVTVGAAAVAVAILARALPLPTAASVAVALLAAAGAGVALGGATDLGAKGALLGLGAGVCALIGHRVASYDYPSRFVHFTAGVALPLAAAAPAVYLLGRALG